MSLIMVLPEALVTMSAYVLDLDDREALRCLSMFVSR